MGPRLPVPNVAGTMMVIVSCPLLLVIKNRGLASPKHHDSEGRTESLGPRLPVPNVASKTVGPPVPDTVMVMNASCPLLLVAPPSASGVGGLCGASTSSFKADIFSGSLPTSVQPVELQRKSATYM